MDGIWQPFDAHGRRKYLTSTEQAALAVGAIDAPLADWALTMVLLLTGCRLSEALEMQLCQIDIHQKQVVLRTLKRRRTHMRAVPVPAVIYSWVWRGLWDAGLTPFCPIWTYSRTTAWRRVKRVMASVGIEDGPHASPKGFRHGFAVGAISAGVPLTVLQKWMGHAKIETTARYLDVGGAEERALAKAFWGGLQFKD